MKATGISWTLTLMAVALPAVAWSADAAPKPTATDLFYGPEKEQILDFWKADAKGSRPVLVFIHGGGWTSGDKRSTPPKEVAYWLAKGVSCAKLNE